MKFNPSILACIIFLCFIFGFHSLDNVIFFTFHVVGISSLCLRSYICGDISTSIFAEKYFLS